MRFGILKMGLGALALAVGAPAMGATLSLSLLVDPNAHTWQAFASLNDPTSSGLAGIQFDVTSAGGITLGTTQGFSKKSFNDLPNGKLSDAATSAGFTLFRAASDISTTDLQFRGGQDNTQGIIVDPSTNLGSVIFGFGQTAGNYGPENALGGSMAPASWGANALIAHGTFVGDTGSISISGVQSATFALPSQSTVLNSPNGFSTHFLDANGITGQTVPVGVPEPSSLLGTAVLAGFMFFRRRRSA